LIDIHTHILPKNFPDFSKKFGDDRFVSLRHTGSNCAEMIQDGKTFRKVDHRLWESAKRIEDCDQTGVRVQVLSTVPVLFSYWAKGHDALELSRYLNDHIAQTVAEGNERFLGLGTVPLQDLRFAIPELERCKKELKLSGVEIGTHVNGMNLDDPKLFPFYEAAQELNLCVFVHAWDMLAKDRMQKHWLPWLVGMPAETTIALASMIFGGIFDRFPKLRVAFSHGGGAFPFLLGRISKGFQVRPDLCATHIQKDPNEYVGRFWVDSIVNDKSTLSFLFQKLGSSSVAFGSDYPFPLGDDRPPNLTEKDQKQVMELSAKAWLGL
jgi:aminocarboxymuconate-semialdehyde decarboxylase